RHPPPPRLYTLSLHDALPILQPLALAGDREAAPDHAPAQTLRGLGDLGRSAELLQAGREVAQRDVVEVGVAVAGEERSVDGARRSEEHTSELQSPYELVCRLL